MRNRELMRLMLSAWAVAAARRSPVTRAMVTLVVRDVPLKFIKNVEIGIHILQAAVNEDSPQLVNEREAPAMHRPLDLLYVASSEHLGIFDDGFVQRKAASCPQVFVD